MAHTGEGYNFNHGVSIKLPILSSKIINGIPIEGDMYITQCIEDSVSNLYVVETSDYNQENDEGNNEDEEDDVDDEEDGFDVDTNTLDADMTEAFA